MLTDKLVITVKTAQQCWECRSVMGPIWEECYEMHCLETKVVVNTIMIRLCRKVERVPYLCVYKSTLTIQVSVKLPDQRQRQTDKNQSVSVFMTSGMKIFETSVHFNIS